MPVDHGHDQAEYFEGGEGYQPRERKTEKSIAFNQMYRLILTATVQYFLTTYNQSRLSISILSGFSGLRMTIFE